MGDALPPRCSLGVGGGPTFQIIWGRGPNLAILLSWYPSAAHSPQCFQSPLRKCSPGPRKEDPGLAVEDSGFKPRLFCPAGCLWTVAPTARDLGVPICRMRKDDWLILFFDNLGTSIKARAGGGVREGGRGLLSMTHCRAHNPLPGEGAPSWSLQPTVQEGQGAQGCAQ